MWMSKPPRVPFARGSVKRSYELLSLFDGGLMRDLALGPSVSFSLAAY